MLQIAVFCLDTWKFLCDPRVVDILQHGRRVYASLCGDALLDSSLFAVVCDGAHCGSRILWGRWDTNTHKHQFQCRRGHDTGCGHEVCLTAPLACT